MIAFTAIPTYITNVIIFLFIIGNHLVIAREEIRDKEKIDE